MRKMIENLFCYEIQVSEANETKMVDDKGRIEQAVI